MCIEVTVVVASCSGGKWIGNTRQGDRGVAGLR